MKSAHVASLLLAGFGVLANGSLLEAADNFVRIQGDQFVLNGQVYHIKGTNYYPRDHMWASMWSSFDVGQITADAQRMHDYGMNAVRILVPYSNGGWNGPNVSTSKLQQLEQVVNIMGDQGIRSVVTLFDWETSFAAAGTTRETENLKYLNAIVDRLKNSPYVLMWDVKNEPDHPANYGWCDCNPGACGDWDCNGTARDKIVSWLQRMCNAVRARDPNHPVSAGMRWWENLTDVLSFEDVAIFHSYWGNIGQEITETRGYMGSNQKPILVEEWGWPSNPNPCNRDGQVITAYNETQQLNVYTSHLNGFLQYNIAGGLQWMTFDAKLYTSNPDETFEAYFGLWKYDYTLKPAGVYYRDNYPVPLFPKVALTPNPLSAFTATVSGTNINLNWTNPITSSFMGTMIRYATNTYPATPSDGLLLCDRSAAPGSTDSFRHEHPQPGIRYYYSAFPYNYERTYGSESNANQMCVVRVDFDADGDVDMADYARMQSCISGPFVAQNTSSCSKAKLDGDSDVDADDVSIFVYCFTGPGVALVSGCSP